MGFWTGGDDEGKSVELRRRETEAIDALNEATVKLVEIEARLSGATDSLEITEERNRLTKEVTDLEIRKDKIEADHAALATKNAEDAARERREIEHKTALVLEGAERDQANAKLEAELAVREENLTKAEERYEEHLEFVEKRFEEHTKRLDGIVDKVLDALPNVNAALAIGEPRRELAPGVDKKD